MLGEDEAEGGTGFRRTGDATLTLEFWVRDNGTEGKGGTSI